MVASCLDEVNTSPHILHSWFCSEEASMNDMVFYDVYFMISNTNYIFSQPAAISFASVM